MRCSSVSRYGAAVAMQAVRVCDALTAAYCDSNSSNSHAFALLVQQLQHSTLWSSRCCSVHYFIYYSVLSSVADTFATADDTVDLPTAGSVVDSITLQDPVALQHTAPLVLRILLPLLLQVRHHLVRSAAQQPISPSALSAPPVSLTVRLTEFVFQNYLLSNCTDQHVCQLLHILSLAHPIHCTHLLESILYTLLHSAPFNSTSTCSAVHTVLTTLLNSRGTAIAFVDILHRHPTAHFQSLFTYIRPALHSLTHHRELYDVLRQVVPQLMSCQ
uniref:ATP-dependent RNA helicase DBP7 n=1 Tax=Lygus hesperus TaxID=30085 RepID=A0A0A9W620_LYGHE